MILDLFRTRHTCRHPSNCTTAVSRDELMCAVHDDGLTPRDGDQISPLNLARRNPWPVNGRRRRYG